MVNLTNARARARDVAAAINCEGSSCPTFARASLNVAAAATLLNTLPLPSTDRVDKVSILSPSRSKAIQQKTAMELPMGQTASSPAQMLARVRPHHPNRHPEPLVHRQARWWDKGAHSKHRVRNPRHDGRDDWEGCNLGPEGPGPKAFGSNVP
jgi:hypothetical protein